MVNRQEKRRRIVVNFGILLFFAISFYLVQFSPWSSDGLRKYNSGYGTFDMKFYNATIVNQVLNKTSKVGFAIEKVYYIFDYIFVIAIGTLQVTLSFTIFNFAKSKLPGRVLAGIAISRGIFDTIENTLLLSYIFIFSNPNQQLINIASIATKFKFCMIGLWAAMFAVGVVLKFFNRISRKTNEVNCIG